MLGSTSLDCPGKAMSTSVNEALQHYYLRNDWQAVEHYHSWFLQHYLVIQMPAMAARHAVNYSPVKVKLPWWPNRYWPSWSCQQEADTPDIRTSASSEEEDEAHYSHRRRRGEVRGRAKWAVERGHRCHAFGVRELLERRVSRRGKGSRGEL